MNLSSIFPVYDHWGYDLRQKQLLLGQTKGWMFPSFSSPFFLPRYSEHKTPTGNLAHFGHFSSKWVIAWGGFFFLSFCPGFFPTHPRHDVIESNHRTQCIGFFWRHWCIIALPLFISCQQSFLSQFLTQLDPSVLFTWYHFYPPALPLVFFVVYVAIAYLAIAIWEVIS